MYENRLARPSVSRIRFIWGDVNWPRFALPVYTYLRIIDLKAFSGTLRLISFLFVSLSPPYRSARKYSLLAARMILWPANAKKTRSELCLDEIPQANFTWNPLDSFIFIFH